MYWLPSVKTICFIIKEIRKIWELCRVMFALAFNVDLLFQCLIAHLRYGKMIHETILSDVRSTKLFRAAHKNTSHHWFAQRYLYKLWFVIFNWYSGEFWNMKDTADTTIPLVLFTAKFSIQLPCKWLLHYLRRSANCKRQLTAYKRDGICTIFAFVPSRLFYRL